MLDNTNLTDCQQKGLNLIKAFINNELNTNEILISGYAGTGKSFLIAYALNNCFYEEDKIEFLTPTHKARRVIDDFIKTNCPDKKNINANTIHSYLKLTRKYKQKKQIFVESYQTIKNEFDADFNNIDEASMIDNDIYFLCQKHLNKIIWLGDKYQLPPIDLPKNQNIAMPFMLDEKYKVELNEVVRYSGSILKLATHIIDVLDNPNIQFNYKKYQEGDYQYRILHTLFKDYIKKYNEGLNCKFITYTNERTREINKELRLRIYKEDSINRFIKGELLNANEIISDMYDTETILARTCDDLIIQSIDISKDYAYIYKYDENQNNISINMINHKFLFYYLETDKGLIRTIHEDDFKQWIKYLDNIADLCKKRKLDWKIFHHIKESNHQLIYPYSITANKAQGSTYNHTYVDYTDIKKCININERFKRLYTSITRASETLLLGV